MDTLLKIVRFTNKTFALWVLLFGALSCWAWASRCR